MAGADARRRRRSRAAPASPRPWRVRRDAFGRAIGQETAARECEWRAAPSARSLRARGEARRAAGATRACRRGHNGAGMSARDEDAARVALSAMPRRARRRKGRRGRMRARQRWRAPARGACVNGFASCGAFACGEEEAGATACVLTRPARRAFGAGDARRRRGGIASRARRVRLTFSLLRVGRGAAVRVAGFPAAFRRRDVSRRRNGRRAVAPSSEGRRASR